MGIRGTAFSLAARSAYSLLALLPEDKANEYGQLALTHLPVEYATPEIDDWGIGIWIGEMRIPTPVILASYYKDPAVWDKAFALGIGAVTTKTTTIKERPYKPRRVFRRGRGFVNHEQYPNYGLEKTRTNIERFRMQYKGSGKLIVSIGAVEDLGEYMTLARELGLYTDALEINASSVNTALAYNMANNPYFVERISSGVREIWETPVIWKLSPDFPEQNRRTVMPILIKNEIDAVEWANTTKVRDERLPGGFGGLSGPELYDGMAQGVLDLRRAFGNDISIIACGGIDSAVKALGLLDHADAVAMLSGFVRDISLPSRINEAYSARRILM